MAKRFKEGEYSSKISSMINSAPDYGEEDDDLTRVDQIGGEEPHSDSGDELNLAQFRKINIELLDAQDEKYAGFRASRKDFDEEKAFGSDDTGSVDSESEVEEVEVSEEGEQDVSEEESNFVEISAKVASDIEKGHAIRNQLSLWDSLLESRIKFQKCLTSANKLPQRDNMAKFRAAGGEEFEKAQQSCKGSINKVLNSFLDLQKLCLDVNTKQYEDKIGKRGMDDEITSSDSEAESKIGFHGDKKRRKLGTVSEEIRELHEAFIPFRNDTIQKWNDKTRVTQMGSKDFSAFEQSTLKQIEMILLDKQRLIKRTRTKRSNYRILGDEEPAAKVAKTEECCEIFDDDDFYHQLLRELLERKTTDVTDPVQLSRQWIDLQRARSKMKRPVDQKASKGRKLRYNVHQKMVNFMMPVDNTTWADEAKSELFSSIFGQKSA